MQASEKSTKFMYQDVEHRTKHVKMLLDKTSPRVPGRRGVHPSQTIKPRQENNAQILKHDSFRSRENAIPVPKRPLGFRGNTDCRLDVVLTAPTTVRGQQITIQIIWTLAWRYKMLGRICLLQIQPSKDQLDHADYEAYTRQHNLDNADQEYICPACTIYTME